MVNDAKVARIWTQRIRSRAPSVASTQGSASNRSSKPPTTPPTAPSPSQKAPSQPISPSTPPSGSRRRKAGSSDVRSREAPELKCRKRDNKLCIVTRSGPPTEVAHIFPFAMRHLQGPAAITERQNPWVVLKMFWSEERVDRWFNAIDGPGTETVENLFCLAPSVHKYHERAYFAFRPISTDEERKKLELEFFWLPWVRNASAIRISERPSLHSSPDFRADEEGHIVKLFNVQTDQKLSCGDRIVMDTADPEDLPLPNFALLDLQWVLQRLVALHGGAEPLDLPFHDDDDDDSDGVGVESDDDDDYTSEQSTLSSPNEGTDKPSQLLDDAFIQ
ncbi:hypothetical protein AJ79_07356 [Helicocarpus griseus UAMH5409]|uniref:HNH nuclease domain-containing protein n=1 Tax=Helicocarpus griseus UAMH5409 TaxID=1447875 RepID=A0A2B7X419_9EURO|nr:hypothetical protein AJ79_07356 [Helicocarpus griseus UAMH5409]